jgi:hypothetical protein
LERLIAGCGEDSVGGHHCMTVWQQQNKENLVMSFSLAELRSKQGKIMSAIVDRGAQGLQVALVKAAKELALTIPGAVVLEPPSGSKSAARAGEKVTEKYGGDWLEIKDMARCTLVVENSMQIDNAVRAVRAKFRASNGFQVIEEKETLASEDSAGYSGNSVIVSSGGNKGEIQINTPPLMYAKSLPEFRAAMPKQEALMKASFPMVPGGLGHQLYEIHRDSKRPEALRAACGKASRLYYNYFRSCPVSLHRGMMAWDAVMPLMFIRFENSPAGALRRA